MKRWVKVFWKYKPTQTQIRVLAKGLNFSITPEHVPTNDIVMVTEVVSQQLNHENGQPDELRTQN